MRKGGIKGIEVVYLLNASDIAGSFLGKKLFLAAVY